jgi:outer membrane protein assembly factor BamB
LASSPWIEGNHVYLVCDHDGDRFKSFDSYLTALDLATGQPAWKTERRGLLRSWSSPVMIAAAGRRELLVNAQDDLRAYDPATGDERWRATGMAGWVTPTPVFGHGLIFAQSGRDGPVMALKPGGSGDVTATHIAWQKPGGPYVCSAVLYEDHLYVHNEQGVLSCVVARTGELAYRQRLEGKFWASSVAGDGKVFITNEEGMTYVIRAGRTYDRLATNDLKDYTLASPALSGGQLFIRTEKHLWCIEKM